MAEQLDPNLDPAINKCVTCGLFRTYRDPKLDNLFASLGKLHADHKINSKLSRKIFEPGPTIFCSVGRTESMKLDELCQFHQTDFGYSSEHYATIYSAQLTNILAEETKTLTVATKNLAVIAIVIAVVLGILQIGIGIAQLKQTPPQLAGTVSQSLLHLLALLSCP